mmetsp:Transcript_18373/g.42546  ORF Transcript_18373/g.42546 Transcript_18373/m.42546 type:complete len:215 (-) Transcript_18373:263-907(-)
MEHSSPQSQDEMKGTFRFHSHSCQCVSVFELISTENEALLVWWNSFPFLDCPLHLYDCCACIHRERNLLPSQSLYVELDSFSDSRGNQGGSSKTNLLEIDIFFLHEFHQPNWIFIVCGRRRRLDRDTKIGDSFGPKFLKQGRHRGDFFKRIHVFPKRLIAENDRANITKLLQGKKLGLMKWGNLHFPGFCPALARHWPKELVGVKVGIQSTSIT